MICWPSLLAWQVWDWIVDICVSLYLSLADHHYTSRRLNTMAIQVVEFSNGGVKNSKDFCLRINMLKGNYWILRIGLMGRCQKHQNLTKIWLSKTIFYVKNYPNLSQFIFSFKIFNPGALFCYWQFWITSIFKSLYFLKLCPTFDTCPLTQSSKFNNFLWVCWFLGNNLSNFVAPVWKLNNPYCHTEYIR